MTYNDTEILIQKYLNGETSAEEERLLALEVSRENVPEDWKIIAGILGELTVDEALFDKIIAERKQKPQIIKLWPWVAAACIAAFLIVFLGPPKDEVSTQSQTAKAAIQQKQSDARTNSTEREQIPPKDKVESPKKVAELKMATPHFAPSKKVKAKRKVSVSKGMAKASQVMETGQVAKPETNVRELTKVEEGDIVSSEDPRMQFEEQARALRDRGNRVIQRVSLNGLPSNNYQFNDL